MAWVCVDKDGTEKLSNYEPFRRRRQCSILWGVLNGFYTKNQSNKWANCWSSDRKDLLPFDGVILPKGSIEKLINRKMTWKDEPIKL